MPRLRCDKCLWWDAEHKRLEGAPAGTGYCRKHKPVVFNADGRYWGGWPLTDAQDFCGEHRGAE